MKRFIYITLLTAFSMPLLAQSTLFLYEYDRNSCYYALEVAEGSI